MRQARIGTQGFGMQLLRFAFFPPVRSRQDFDRPKNGLTAVRCVLCMVALLSCVKSPMQLNWRHKMIES